MLRLISRMQPISTQMGIIVNSEKNWSSAERSLILTGRAFCSFADSLAPLTASALLFWPKVGSLQKNLEICKRNPGCIKKNRKFLIQAFSTMVDLRMALSLEDRFVGCLLGGACGDALGAAVEMQHKDDIFKTYGPLGIHDFGITNGILGGITDDTQMTLFTAEGLISAIRSWMKINKDRKSSFKPEDAVPALYQSYLRWLHTQRESSASHLFHVVQSDGWLVKVPKLNHRRGPGQTCLRALASGEVGTTSNRINNSKGCGGVMRAAPCGLVVHGAFSWLDKQAKAQLAFQLGCSSSAITHTHPAGWLSGGCLAAIISFIVSGHPLREAVEQTIVILENESESMETLQALAFAMELANRWGQEAASASPPWSEAVRQQKALAHIEQMSGNSARGGGWVGEEAIAIAVYCSLVSQDEFESGVRYAVNHSGDSDSTGAITGNILGALLGVKGIPQKWASKVEMPDVIEQVASDLMKVGDSVPGQGYWEQRYPSPRISV